MSRLVVLECLGLLWMMLCGGWIYSLRYRLADGLETFSFYKIHTEFQTIFVWFSVGMFPLSFYFSSQYTGVSSYVVGLFPFIPLSIISFCYVVFSRRVKDLLLTRDLSKGVTQYRAAVIRFSLRYMGSVTGSVLIALIYQKLLLAECMLVVSLIIYTCFDLETQMFPKASDEVVLKQVKMVADSVVLDAEYQRNNSLLAKLTKKLDFHKKRYQHLSQIDLDENEEGD